MTVSVDNTKRARITTYVLLGAIVLLLALGGLAVFRSAKSSADAEEKADQLIAALEAAGLPTPSKDQIVGVLGDDGGAICADPNSSLKRAILNSQLSNGAGGPGTRPVIADSRAVQGELLVIKIYCPDALEDFTKFVEDTKFDDVVNG
jgi:hypothetical protein